MRNPVLRAKVRKQSPNFSRKYIFGDFNEGKKRLVQQIWCIFFVRT